MANYIGKITKDCKKTWCVTIKTHVREAGGTCVYVSKMEGEKVGDSLEFTGVKIEDWKQVTNDAGETFMLKKLVQA